MTENKICERWKVYFNEMNWSDDIRLVGIGTVGERGEGTGQRI